MAVRVFCSFADIHKMVNNRNFPVQGDEAREVRAWLKTAELLAASDDDYQELLSFYLAYGYAALGEKDRACPLLYGLMADTDDINAAAAARVAIRLRIVNLKPQGLADRRPTSRPWITAPASHKDGAPVGLDAGEGATVTEIMEQYYPAGYDADQRLWKQSKGLFNPPVSSPGTMLLAGDLFVEMGMIEEGLAAYRRAAGLKHNSDFVRGVSGPVWTQMGAAYGRVGKWREALACHYKALASGEDLAKMLPAIQKARQGLRDKTVVQPPQRKPDATKLEQVARHCVATDLFDDALAAARAAAKVRGSENEALVKAIYRVKAWAYTEIIAACDEGVVYRGQKVTREEFEEACRRGDWVPQRDRKRGYDFYESRPKVPGPASEPTSRPGKQRKSQDPKEQGAEPVLPPT
jgi:tetratricopeptide (TPR) repeat protein